MNIKQAIDEIARFWQGDMPFGNVDGTAQVARLRGEFACNIPDEVADYVSHVCPQKDVFFTAVGNPLQLYGVPKLTFAHDGYSHCFGERQTDWQDGWLLLGDEGADPVLLRLADFDGKVERLTHGCGSWEYGETLADSIGQWLLCAAWQHTILANDDDPIVDDERGFCLQSELAKVYFPQMKCYAGSYYDVWCSVFNNA